MPSVIERKRLAKVVKLTETEQNTLERKCHNRLSWTDGGHWMGSGTAPDCKLKENIKNAISHTVRVSNRFCRP